MTIINEDMLTFTENLEDDESFDLLSCSANFNSSACALSSSSKGGGGIGNCSILGPLSCGLLK